MRPRLGSWRLVAAATAVAGALAIPGLPAAAAPVAPHSVSAAASAAPAACGITRPHSGKLLLSRISGGQGRLTIKNHLSHDSVIVLVRGRAKAIGVYVRAHASATVGNIKSGTYTISGNTVLTTSDVGNPGSIDYCVQTNHFHITITQAMSMDMAGQATIIEDTVATKQ